DRALQKERLVVQLLQGEAYVTEKEKTAWDLAIALRAKGKINTPGPPFEAADDQEVDSLIAKGAIEIMKYDPTLHKGRMWKTRLVREIKGQTSAQPYEKSRMVLQGYNDPEKEELLTQAPTIQRMSQRLLLAIGAGLIARSDMRFELRDITQAYVQSEDFLQRTIIAQLPKEIRHRYPANTVLWIKKSLYGLAESGTYWWKTYHAHHRNALGMKPSSYDPCLLYITGNQDCFGITGMQTDDLKARAQEVDDEKSKERSEDG
ncbi:hypothetical protein MCOR13_011804, partial [Pyricularia oryzae]